MYFNGLYGLRETLSAYLSGKQAHRTTFRANLKVCRYSFNSILI